MMIIECFWYRPLLGVPMLSVVAPDAHLIGDVDVTDRNFVLQFSKLLFSSENLLLRLAQLALQLHRVHQLLQKLP
jgi:hypothetical protein